MKNAYKTAQHLAHGIDFKMLNVTDWVGSGRQTFSVKVHIVNVSGFEGHDVSVLTIQLCSGVQK